MKRKETNKSVNKNLIILVVVASAFTVIASLSVNKSSVPSSMPQTNTTVDSGGQAKIYQSKNLKFSIVIPNPYTIQEGQTYVDITISSMLFDIVRNGTNFESLKDYVKDFDAKRRVTVMEEKDLTINGYQTISRIETNTATEKKQKIYYIYVDSWVYSLSTSSEALFSALDQIAQSFSYTP